MRSWEVRSMWRHSPMTRADSGDRLTAEDSKCSANNLCSPHITSYLMISVTNFQSPRSNPVPVLEFRRLREGGQGRGGINAAGISGFCGRFEWDGPSTESVRGWRLRRLRDRQQQWGLQFVWRTKARSLAQWSAKFGR